MKLKTYARQIVRSFGYELIGNGKGWSELKTYRLSPRKLPHEAGTGNLDPYCTPFSVSIADITSRLGFSFAEDGWHPFVETLKEYEANPLLRYEESTLARLYNNYCPTNAQDVLLDHLKQPMEPFCFWPADFELVRYVWVLNRYTVGQRLKQINATTQKVGWILYGPHSHAYGEKEFNRLIAVYDSIKNNGYLPELAGEDRVNGYFLKQNNQLRFVLLQGNHRVATLKALNYQHVDVLIRQGHPPVIDRAKLSKWTEEGGGIYPAHVAQHLFDTLFNATGLQKARRHNITGLRNEIFEPRS